LGKVWRSRPVLTPSTVCRRCFSNENCPTPPHPLTTPPPPPPPQQDVPYAEALQDLRSRVQKYEAQYETIEEDDLSYIKIFNLSSKILANNIFGRLSKTIIPGLMSWHIGTRPI